MTITQPSRRIFSSTTINGILDKSISNIIITEKAHHINNLQTEHLNKQINITVWKFLTKMTIKLLYAFPKHSSWVQISINNLNCAIGIAQDC
jgi:hypothetical protein